MPQVDSGLMVQVDVKYDANHIFEIVVAFKSLRGGKQDAVVPVFPQQPLQAPEGTRIVIDNKDGISVWHERHPWRVRRHGLEGPLQQSKSEPIKLTKGDQRIPSEQSLSMLTAHFLLSHGTIAI